MIYNTFLYLVLGGIHGDLPRTVGTWWEDVRKNQQAPMNWAWGQTSRGSGWEWIRSSGHEENV